jgi:FkbM family methyltransferase
VTAPPQTVFDSGHYLRHIEARGKLISRLAPALTSSLQLSTALDAGCGIGFFASLLKESGLDVRAFDGRQENIEEARARYPGIPFYQGDIEDSSIRNLGRFDLVLCFGLLYHLENPMRAIRNLRALTGKVLLLESMCVASQDAFMLLREEPRDESQSLTDLAFYASEGCLVKMLYRSGFKAVYRAASLPDHDDFRETKEHGRRRTVLLAAYEPLAASDLIPLAEPHEAMDPWEKPPSRSLRFARRIRTFLASPASAKYASLARRVRRRFPWATVPVRLPFGAWWLARNDHVSNPLVEKQFETQELSFVQRFLRPGMTVLDIGAHHGLYTLLASKRIGEAGRVVAFEPSQRERRALRRHLALNRCRNVTTQELALSSETAEREFYVVEEWADGCNSLRQPALDAKTSLARVQVDRLDAVLGRLKIDHVDFIKLDVEGAELGVLEGGAQLLERRPRPVILAEVQDIRTQPWGYRAKEIINHLSDRGFRWFRLCEDGSLGPLDLTSEAFDGNFVAWPEELGTTLP